MIRTIAFFYNLTCKDSQKVVSFLSELAQQYGIGVINSLEKADLVISVGGDGTFLLAQQKVINNYIIGINPNIHRSVGYYDSLTINDLDKIKEVFEGNYEVIELTRLSAIVNGKEFLSLNEVQIYPKIRYKLLKAEIEIKTKEVTYNGFEFNSGLLVYTPTGASGFASNLEGAFGLNSIGLVAIAPVKGLLKKFRSITIPIKEFEGITVKGELFVNVDSQNVEIPTSKVEITLGKPLKYLVPESIKGKFLQKLYFRIY